MKRIAMAAALVAATALGSIGAANAAGVEFDVGGGGVYVGPRHDHDWRWRRHHWRGDYASDCRVVVRTHINRWGERVQVRRRICD